MLHQGMLNTRWIQGRMCSPTRLPGITHPPLHTTNHPSSISSNDIHRQKTNTHIRTPITQTSISTAGMVEPSTTALPTPPLTHSLATPADMYKSLTHDQLIALLASRSLSFAGTHEERALRLAEHDIAAGDVRSDLPTHGTAIQSSSNSVPASTSTADTAANST